MKTKQARSARLGRERRRLSADRRAANRSTRSESSTVQESRSEPVGEMDSSDTRRQSNSTADSGGDDNAADSFGEPLASSRLGLALLSFASSLALWASFAPLSWGWLAWLAPAGWVLVSQRSQPLRTGDYLILWLSGAAFWLATLQGIRLAFWPLYFGWIALSLYLAVYTPLFVGITRSLQQKAIFGRPVPPVLAAPIAWVGLTMLRCYLLSGFCGNMLVHTQTDFPIVIQLADQLGGYGIDFVMMTACAALVHLYRSLLERRRSGSAGPRAVLPAAWAVLLVAANLGYGTWRLQQANSMFATREPMLKVLLVQENMPTMFDSDPQALADAWMSYLNTTRQLTQTELRQGDSQVADLVVWPESTFTAGVAWTESTVTSKLPRLLEELNHDLRSIRDLVLRRRQEFAAKANAAIAAAKGQAAGELSGEDVGQLGGKDSGQPDRSTGSPPAGQAQSTRKSSLVTERPYLLVGSDAVEIRPDDLNRFNSALMINPDGQLVGRYDKMHLVMFGEYIPLGPWLAWLGELFNFSGATAGKQANCFQIAETWVAPNICFESMMPRVVNRQVRQLSQQGTAPDLLINLTNDSWFRGSSMLDHHLACSILCAVENRRPLLAAANSGISAEIDGCGRVLQRTERFAVDGIWARPIADNRAGLVQLAGYPFAWFCLICVGATVLSSVYGSGVQIWNRRGRNRRGR